MQEDNKVHVTLMLKNFFHAYAFIVKKYMYAVGLNDVTAKLELTLRSINYLLSHQANNNFKNILAAYRIKKVEELLKGKHKIKE